jgi:hypothetical protein
MGVVVFVGPYEVIPFAAREDTADSFHDSAAQRSDGGVDCVIVKRWRWNRKV